MSEPVIRMENIVKTYYLGKPNELEILHGINLTVNKGNLFPSSVNPVPVRVHL